MGWLGMMTIGSQQTTGGAGSQQTTGAGSQQTTGGAGSQQTTGAGTHEIGGQLGAGWQAVCFLNQPAEAGPMVNSNTRLETKTD